jgi:uncharacterized RDD family membrane protein YckC
MCVAPPLGRRLASLLYETLVSIAVVLVAVTLFSLLTTAMPAVPTQRPVLLGTCFLALAAYFIYCWRHGQTLAMQAWKLRIVDVHGAPLTLGRACIRFVLGWVWVAPPLAVVAAFKPHAASLSQGMSLGFGAVVAWGVAWSLASMLRADRQFWHDAAAGTRIVAA